MNCVRLILVSFFACLCASHDDHQQITQNHDLFAGEHLSSVNKHFKMKLKSDGKFVVKKDGKTVLNFVLGRKVSNPDLKLQKDGNLVMYSKTSGKKVWESMTHGKDKLVFENNGNLVVRNKKKEAVWASNQLRNGQYLQKGQFIVSPNHHFKFYLKANGHYMLQKDGKTIYKSHAAAGSTLKMQKNGNFVLRKKSGKIAWQTRTHGKKCRLIIINSGMLLIQCNGRAKWIKRVPRKRRRLRIRYVLKWSIPNKSIWSCGSSGKCTAAYKKGKLSMNGKKGKIFQLTRSGVLRLKQGKPVSAVFNKGGRKTVRLLNNKKLKVSKGGKTRYFTRVRK